MRMMIAEDEMEDDDVEDDDVEEDGDEDGNVEDEVEDAKVEGDDVEDDDVKGEEDGDVENDDVEDDDVEKEDRSQDLGPHFVRACAFEMHFNISQEPRYTKKCRKNARARSEHPDQALAFTIAVRAPQCGHTVWGKSCSYMFLVKKKHAGRIPHLQKHHFSYPYIATGFFSERIRLRSGHHSHGSGKSEFLPEAPLP